MNWPHGGELIAHYRTPFESVDWMIRRHADGVWVNTGFTSFPLTEAEKHLKNKYVQRMHGYLPEQTGEVVAALIEISGN